MENGILLFTNDLGHPGSKPRCPQQKSHTGFCKNMTPPHGGQVAASFQLNGRLKAEAKRKFQENNLVAYQTECHLGKKHHPLQGEKQSKRAISAGCQNISEVPDPVGSTFFGHLRFWRWRGFWGLGVAAESGCMNHDGPSEPKTYAPYGFRFRNFFLKVLKQNIALQITCPMLAVWVSTWGLGSSIRQWPQVFSARP